ncbi:MAG: hypothetical protein ACREVS_18125 [Burkholderiales bacterium]
MKRCLVVLATVIAGGCAVGVKHAYHDVAPELKYPVRGTVAVAVLDRRPYVTDGAKTESFVGVQRGGYGNPFDVETESGRPLATEFQNSVATALTRAGAKVVRVGVKPTTGPAEVRRQLAATGASKSVLITLHDWRVDSYINVNLDHEVVLTVLGPQGQTLATATQKGADRIGSSAINPVGASVEAVPPAYRRKLEELFATPAVANALR